MENQKRPATLNPYLAFDGNCLEAMNFYRDVFEGELTFERYGSMPSDESTGFTMSDEQKEKVMHACLISNSIVLMGADMQGGCGPDDMAGESKGGNCSIMIDSHNMSEAKTWFDRLAEGGEVGMPFEKVFWGATFGMVTDRFNTSWMVNCSEVDESIESHATAEAAA